MAKDRLTQFGFGVVIVGWVVLVADAVLPLFLNEAGHLATVAALRSDVFALAETTIFSGFALAVIGVLRSGFGALHRFFDAVLDRADAAKGTPKGGTRPMPKPSPAAQPIDDPIDDVPAFVPIVEHVPEKPTIARNVRGKNYTILANGAVEVETLLGTRVFASLDEARDYIR